MGRCKYYFSPFPSHHLTSPRHHHGTPTAPLTAAATATPTATKHPPTALTPVPAHPPGPPNPPTALRLHQLPLPPHRAPTMLPPRGHLHIKLLTMRLRQAVRGVILLLHPPRRQRRMMLPRQGIVRPRRARYRMGVHRLLRRRHLVDMLRRLGRGVRRHRRREAGMRMMIRGMSRRARGEQLRQQSIGYEGRQ